MTLPMFRDYLGEKKKMDADMELPPAGNCCGPCKDPDCKHKKYWREQKEKDMNEAAPKIEANDSGFEKVELPKDMVNQPSHYNYGEIECIDAIKGMLGEEGFKAYCRGNAMKYTWRAGLKFDEVEDLKKASWYNRMAAGDDPRLDDKSATWPYKRATREVLNTRTGYFRTLTEAEQKPGAVITLGPDDIVVPQLIPTPPVSL